MQEKPISPVVPPLLHNTMSTSVCLQTAALRSFTALGCALLVREHSAVVIKVGNNEFLFALQASSSINSPHILVIDNAVAKLVMRGRISSDPVECVFLSNIPVVLSAKIKPNTFNDYCLFSENFVQIQQEFISQISCFALNQQYFFWINKSTRVSFAFESTDDAIKRGRLIENSFIEVIPVLKGNESNHSNGLYVVKICSDEHFDSPNCRLIVPHLNDKCIDVPIAISQNQNDSLQTVFVRESDAIKNGLFSQCKVLQTNHQFELIRVPSFDYSLLNSNSKSLISILQSHRSVLLVGSSLSGKSSIIRDLFFTSKCIVIDSIDSIFEYLLSTEEITFLFDNSCQCYLTNRQNFIWSLKRLFKNISLRQFRVVFSWNSNVVEPPPILKYLFDFVFKIKNPSLQELVQLCNNDFDLVEQLENKPIGQVLRRIKFPTHCSSQNTFLPIVGYESVKKALIQNILWPIQYGKLYKENGIGCKGYAVLYGPSGCGKSTIAFNFIPSLLPNIHLIKIKGPELFGKFMGSSEEAIRSVFAEARNNSPSLIVFDEFDSLAGVRGNDHSGATDRVVNQLLTEIDGVEELSGVFIIATTSRIGSIDPALLRPGRIENKIHVDYPSKQEQDELFDYFSNRFGIDREKAIEKRMTKQLTCADIESICLEVAMNLSLTSVTDRLSLLNCQLEREEKIIGERQACK